MTEPGATSGAAPAGPSVTRRVLLGGPVRLAGHATSVVISLATVALTLRHLGVEEAGRLFAGLAALALVNALADLGLANIGVRDYSTAEVGLRQGYLRDLATARITVLVLALGPAVVIAGWLLGQDGGYAAGLAGGGAAFAAAVLVATAAIPFAQRLDTTTVSILQVLQSAGALVTVLLLVRLHAATPWFFVVQLPGICLALAYLRRRGGRGAIPWPRAPGLRVLRRLLNRKILLVAAAAIASVGFYRLGALGVAVLSSEFEAGIYGAAFRITDVLEGVAPLLMMIVLPRLAVRGVPPHDRLGARVRLTLAVMAPLGALVAACTFGGAELGVATVGGPDFAAAATPLRIMSLVLLLSFPTQVYGYALLAMHRHATLLVSVGAGLVAALVGLLALVPPWGAVGGALALLGAQVVVLLCYARAYASSQGAEGHLRTLLLSTVAYAAAVAAASAVPGRWAPLLTAAVVSLAVVAQPVRRTLLRAAGPTRSETAS